MGEKHRFSKALALQVLDMRAARIAAAEQFNRSHGTAQLQPKTCSDAEVNRIIRAVEYGRMRAFEEFACAIEEGFQFEQTPTQGETP